MVEIVYERICTTCHRDPCICEATAAAKTAMLDSPLNAALYKRLMTDDPDTVGEPAQPMLAAGGGQLIGHRTATGAVLSGCAVRAAAQLIDEEPLMAVELPTVIVDCPRCGGGIQLSVSKTKV